ncbi:MAG: hypothetical protein VX272_01935, partial [Planctomycetota bacterium]|nr:hypothetical protein [Planctomycetota bacterium]
SLKGEEPGLDCSESETGKQAVWLSAGHGFDPNMDRESVGKFNSGRLSAIRGLGCGRGVGDGVD